MADLVHYAAQPPVAVITIDNPPLNALGQGVRAGLDEALRQALEDDAIGAVVLEAAGRTWPVGADIREFGKPPVRPILFEVCARLASAKKPVIAALHGSVFGGGLELALVCALRIAAPKTLFALPEVTLGILPGAGGTQRLPRLVGPADALAMMLTGTPVSTARALEMGLVDRVATGDILEKALALALAHAEGRVSLPVAAERRPRAAKTEPAQWLDAVAAARAVRRPPHEIAARRIIDSVEAALLLPPARGLVFERTAFEDLVATPVARALRHAFLCERGAVKSLPAEARKGGGELRRVTVFGGGPLGSGLVAALLGKGIDVTLIGRDPPGLSAALARVARLQDGAVARDELTAERRKEDWARLKAEVGFASEQGADLVIDALGDDLPAREAHLAGLGRSLSRGVPTLSLTCKLSPAALAAAFGRPEHHAAIWLTEPVSRALQLEVAAPDAALPALAAARRLAERLGWRILRPGDGRAFYGRRVWTALQDVGDRCLSAGALPEEVDLALRQWGLPRGPYERADIYGLNHILNAAPERRPGCLADPVGETLRIWMAGEKREGRGGGMGYYRYDSEAPGGRQADPAIAAQLAHLRARRPLSREAITLRFVAGLANDAAWAIEEGRIAAPAEADLVAMAQHVPRWRGGMMQAADEAGLLRLKNLLSHLAEGGDGFWTPAPVWDERIRNGGRFADLNAGAAG